MAETSVPLSMHLRADGITVLHAPTELDKDSAARVRSALIALMNTEQVPRIVLDFGAVEFVDSTGLGVLVGTLKRARVRGAVFVLADMSERVRKTFRVTGLLKVFTVYDTASAAVEALSAPSPDAA